MLFFALAALTTDVILLRIYQAMGWDQAVQKWIASHVKPYVAVICVLVLTVAVNYIIRTGMDLFQASEAAKPIAMGVGLGVCLSLIPMTQPR